MYLAKHKWLSWLLLIGYMMIMAKLIFFKVTIGGVGYHYSTIAPRLTLRHNFILANFTPFRALRNMLFSGQSFSFLLQNVVGNILLYMPLGFLLPLVFSKLSNARAVTLAGMLISLTFELIQLFGILGNFDVDDILLNTIGTLTGYCCYVLCQKWFGCYRLAGTE